EGVEPEVGERRPAPERQRLPEHPRALLGLGSLRPLEEALEADGVDLLGIDSERVAGRARDERLASQELAQLRDVVLEGRHGRAGRLLSPDLVDDPVGWDDATGVQEQEGQNRALLLPAELDRPAVV